MFETIRRGAMGLGVAAILFGAPGALAQSKAPYGTSQTLPVPPGPAHQPRPHGAVANLKVIDWAGFKGAVSYSFDDAQPSQLEHFAELKATGVPMTEYVALLSRGVIPDFDRRWREVGQAGWELGNHTVHHCHFNEVCKGTTAFDAGQDIDGAAAFITGVLGAPGVWTLAYPFGDLGYEPEASHHVFIARGVQTGLVAPLVGDPFNLPIYAAKAGDTAAAFNAPLDAARGQGRWLIYMFHSILPTQANWFAGVDIHDIVATVDHAKAAGDLWMDTVVNIGAYWRGQTVVAAAIAPTAATRAPVTWTWTLPAHFPPGHRLRVTIDGGVLSQGGHDIAWDGRGYYEIELDAGALSWRP